MKSKSIRQMAYVASTTHMKTAYKTLIWEPGDKTPVRSLYEQIWDNI
jgi:hypothetical protein